MNDFSSDLLDLAFSENFEGTITIANFVAQVIFHVMGFCVLAYLRYLNQAYILHLFDVVFHKL
ncbi:hypothetical protein DYY67_0748 [Candidatus Nitrosotalea sp. TS]|uniref:hypothetical protein n=1 Tax=Candidatus Nitrosotalea sp. TS TaxID=2341020 RepID=UPI00140D5960|nr:hypothetical protein [Candidatus Nitrosotalea sp. TS]NHI02844.1 hypothetical protein [Candidatus Nitrosotalea sp. TS]